MPDRQLTDLIDVPLPAPMPGLEPWPAPTTKAERRAATHRLPKCRCGNVAGMGQTLCRRCREAEEPVEPTDDEVERGARALLERRGFGFYTDPMEDGQDAYDISCEALEEVRVVLKAVRET